MSEYNNYKIKKSNEVLGTKAIDYMLSIINSSLTDEEKAINLYSFCNEYYVEISSIHYDLQPESSWAKKMNIIKNTYRKYSSLGYFKPAKNSYRCSITELKERLKNLKQVSLIIKSDASDYEKGSKLIKMFKNKTSFERHFGIIIRYGKNDDKLANFRSELDNITYLAQELDKYIGVYNKVHETKLTKVEKDILESYISEFSNSKNREVILKKIDISSAKFIKILAKAKKYDAELYQRYLLTTTPSSLSKEEELSILSELISSIKTGEFIDGTKFDTLELIKRIPYEDRNDRVTYLRKVLHKSEILDKEVLLKYLSVNNITDSNINEKIIIKNIMESKTIVDNIEITNSDKDLILDYLKVRGIPFVSKAYAVAKKMFVNGLITSDEIKKFKSKEKIKK